MELVSRMATVNLLAWKESIERELKDNILSFWMEHSVDQANGGFVGEISNDMKINPNADKGLVLHARVLWTFSAAYRIYKDAAYLNMAERAYRYLLDKFWDNQYGGFFWMLDYKGEPIQEKKQVYGQAFAIYALAEYNRATGNADALERAILMFDLLEQHSVDHEYGGYIEALGRDWHETDQLSLSDKDLNEKKSMNTHLHVMEAYTNLYRVWKSDVLKGRLGEIIEITIDHILAPDQRHFYLFFDEQWNVKSHEVSYGHDIEGSWLLVEAAEVLSNPALIKRASKAAIAMAEATLAEGVDEDGGIINEGDSSGWIDTDKHWWPQAEAIVGFVNAYEMTNKEDYLQAAFKTWQFIDSYIIDKVNGEWYWKTDRAGNPDHSQLKVEPWKCPYHNGRMGFEVIERLERIHSK